MLRVSLVVTLFVAACPAPPAPPPGPVDAGPDAPPLGEPIELTANTWTFVDFPTSSCDDGSATGIGVNQGSANNVIAFFNGGGACWDYETCFVLNTADHGPFGEGQLNAIVGSGLHGTILDRSDANNPFKDWSYVFIPYCTGDIHGGDVVQTYTDGTTTKTFAHVGHKNLLAYLERLGATFTAPDQFVVSGASAGGGGAVLNYADFKRYWPSSKMYLLDDSLPFLETGAMDPALVAQQGDSWDLATLVNPLCGGDCYGDLSHLFTGLANSYPDDRMALLSSEQDQVISQFDGLTGPQFQTALDAMVTDVLAPSAPWRTFRTTGNSHTMVANWGVHTAAGVPLETWLTSMVSDSADWVTVGP